MVTGGALPGERLASMILADSGLACELRQVVSDGGAQDGPVLARRLLEERWAGGCAYPAGHDYLMAARELAGRGRGPDAELLHAMAGTERYLAAHESRWSRRYDGYVLLGTDEIRAQVRDGTLELGPARGGIDGARYLTGRYRPASPQYGTMAVLAVTRAGCELVTDWDSPVAAGEWVRGRLPSASGPLMPPGGLVPRLAREEQVLAFVLRYPWGLDAVAAALPGYVFTADVRDEIFAAARMLHTRGGTVDAGTVVGELGRRCAWAPSWAREMLGGPRAPLAAGYVRRLAITEVTFTMAEEAIGELARPCQAGRPSRDPSPAPRPSLPPAAVPQHMPAPLPRAPAPRF